MGKLTKNEVIAELEALEVEFNPEATYNTLVALLKEAGAEKKEEEVDEDAAEEEEESSEEVEEAEEDVPEEKIENVEPVEEKKIEPEKDKAAEEDEEEVGDYLRQYQYRKQTAFGSEQSDPAAGSKAEKMKNHLLAAPRMNFMIPKPSGEDKTVKQSVCLNGYRMDFPKNVYIEVPKPVADILIRSLNLTVQALEKGRIDGNSGKENALR